MATFRIHEDKEKFQQHAVQRGKPFNGGHEKKIVAKKHAIENRATFQSINNGIRQDAKRVKLTVKNTASIKEIKPNVKENDSELETVFEESFLKIEKENEEPKEADVTKNGFPRSLLYSDEYRKDIWQYLTNMERTIPRPKSNYMLKQADLSWKTRSILVDWLASVAQEYKFCDETFHLTVHYIDRFLSQICVVRDKFQLIGAAAMMVAAKMEEYYPLDAKEWSYLTANTFTPRNILKMEGVIMKAMRYKMQPPTIYGFIQHLCSELKMEAKIIHLAMYISELVLLEGEDYVNQFPSKLAAASIVLARHTLSKQKAWPEKLKKVSGYTLKELSPVVQRQQRTFRDSPLKEQQTIQNKYKSEKYNKVALLKPRVLKMNDLDDEE